MRTREFIECIDDFPAVGQPLSDKTLKDMLVSLRGSLHRDMMTMVSQMRWEVDGIGERIHHMENKMGDFAVAHNKLVDAHSEAEDTLTAIKSKLANLEDRSRRNNLKFHGVAEAILPADLRTISNI